jgi:acetolactate synthase I/II/III large subunit
MISRTGGQILVDQLKIHQVQHAFCVPGESYLAVLDALYEAKDSIELIVARQDGGAAFMAGAYGKLTGKPGVALVTRGPGATNASIGVHTAFQDSEPMVLFIGQVASDQVEREAFQEIDYRRMFGPMAKWVAQIDRADRIPEYVSRAFHTAVSGRPGPVVLALPEDMLTATASVPDIARPYHVNQPSMGISEGLAVKAAIQASKRPLVVAGGAGWTQQGVADLQAWAAECNLPVGTAFRFQDVFDNRHPSYVGDIGIGINPKLAQRVRESDCVIALGARLGEMTTSGYTLLQVPNPAQTLIHIHNDPQELGRVYQANVMVTSGMNEFAAAARKLGIGAGAWDDWTRNARADYEAWQAAPAQPMPGAVDLREIVLHMDSVMPSDTVYTNGAGNFSGWLHRYHRYTGLRTELAPSVGSMGYGVPAAIAAKVQNRQRAVISMNGDGDYMMNGQELATAVQYGLGIVFLIVNNGMYGTIRMHQEREYPARVYATALRNPDFPALARAYGAHGEKVVRTDEFAPALARARTAAAAGQPAVIEIVIDPDAITSQTTLSSLRAKAEAAQGPAR